MFQKTFSSTHCSFLPQIYLYLALSCDRLFHYFVNLYLQERSCSALMCWRSESMTECERESLCWEEVRVLYRSFYRKIKVVPNHQSSMWCRSLQVSQHKTVRQVTFYIGARRYVITSFLWLARSFNLQKKRPPPLPPLLYAHKLHTFTLI